MAETLKKQWIGILLTLVFVLCFKYLEIYNFDKDQSLDMAQIQGLELHLKGPIDYILPYPTKNGTYRWSVTGFGLLYFLQKYISGNAIYLIFTALLFLIAFIFAMEISNSPPFAYLFSYLITLGYNFFIVFFDTRVLALIPFLIYGILNFLCFFKYNNSKRFKFYFLLTLILLIFSWDSWIDFGLALLVINFLFKTKGNFIRNTLLISIPLYITLRFLLIGHMGELLNPGREVDFIFNHESWFLGIEDFSTNIIRYIHSALTNYFPLMPLNPLVINSKNPIDLVNSFSPGATFQQDAIFYNYLYGWYLFAGITFTLYLGTVYKYIKKKNLIITSGLALIFFGGFTHYFIKFRPLLVLPYNYSYRQYFSIIGITLLISYLGKYILENKIRGKKTGISFLILICFCFTGMSFFKTKKAIEHSFIHNKLNPPR